MSDDKQAVVDTTGAAAKQAADGTDSARNDGADLDTLLAEFDQSTKRAEPTSTTQTQTATQTDTQPDARLRAIEQELQASRQERFRREMSTVITAVRGDVSEDLFDDDMIEGWLNALAVKDPRLSEAFAQKERNPRQWAKVQGELRKKLSDRVAKLPDKGASEDRAAVAAAVRGASTKVTAEPPPKYGGMNNAEYRKAIREQYGFDPGV